jgi:hypothetical protein
MATNLDVFLPFDAGAGANVTEDDWRDMARHWLPTGVIRGELNDMNTFGDSTGMQVKTNTGRAWIRGHYGENTTQKTLAIAAAHATLARIDRVILRADFTNNRLELDVLTGTAAGSPSAPALTQSSAVWEISLAQVSVPAADTSIDAGQVTSEREWTRAVPHARVRRSNNQGILDSIVTAVTFEVETYDVGNLWVAGSPTRLTAPRAGTYDLKAGVRWATAVAADKFGLVSIRHQGTTDLVASSQMQQWGDNNFLTCSTDYRFAAGEYMEVLVVQKTGATVNLEADGQRGIWASMRWVSD